MPLADAWEGLLTPRLYREEWRGWRAYQALRTQRCLWFGKSDIASTAYVSPRHSFSSGFQEQEKSDQEDRYERRDSFPI